MINYNAALPAMALSGRRGIDVNQWINDVKGNLTALARSMFANNEQGFFYDPNDLSTMYQDAAGTVPVTAAGQPVGLILDKSGRNNHAYQTTSASRPILRKNAVTGANYLEFDGSDDFLQTNNINFTGTDKVSLFAGVRKLSDTVTGMFCELSSNLNNNIGCFYLAAPASNNTPRFGLVVKGSTAGNVESPNLPAPVSAVLSTKLDLLGKTTNLRANGILSANTSAFNGGKFGNYPLYIGRRGGTSFPFSGHIYGLIGIGKLTTDTETAVIEKEIAKRVGVTLNV